MKRLRNHLTGIDQGDAFLFADFENGGDMWTGEGQRERRKQIAFSEPFRSPPTVQTSISLWDVASSTAVRADISAQAITTEGFEIVFSTWGDTRVARVRISWTAIGELHFSDDWVVDD